MDNWGDRDVYHQQEEDNGWARTCLVMSLFVFAVVLVLVLIGVALVVLVGVLL